MDCVKEEFGLLHIWSSMSSNKMSVEINPYLNMSSWYIPFKYKDYNLTIDEYTFRSNRSN